MPECAIPRTGRTARSRQPWPFHCDLGHTEGRHMIMFNRSQIYIGLGLAAVIELVIRVAAR